MEYITIDTSVIITSLRKEEEKHEVCKRLLEKVKDGEFIALEPYTILVETTAAIRRRTGSEELAKRIKRGLELMDSIIFFDMDRIRANDAAGISAKIGVRGMDAVVVQTARENKCALRTLDGEMSKKSQSIVEVMVVDDLI